MMNETRHSLILAVLLVIITIIASSSASFAAHIPEGMSNTLVNFCNDSDGSNFYTKGTVVDVDGEWVDHCSANFLIEYLCDDDYHDKIGRICDAGCVDGACINKALAEEEEEAAGDESADQEAEETEEQAADSERQPSTSDTQEDETGEESLPANVTETYTTDIMVAMNDQDFSEMQRSDKIAMTSSVKTLVKVSDIEPYEMTESELKYFTRQIADHFGENSSQLLKKAREEMILGSLNSEIQRLKSEYPFKGRVFLTDLKTKDAKLYTLLDKIMPVTPDLMAAKIELLTQTITFSSLFDNDPDGVKLTNAKTGIKLTFPEDFNTTGIELAPIAINITEDESHRKNVAEMHIVSTKDGNLTSARFVSSDDRLLIKTSRNRLVNIKTGIELELANFTKDAAIRLTTYSVPDKNMTDRFEAAASQAGLKLVERVGVLKVDKFSLKQGQDIIGTKVIFKLESNLLGRTSPEAVKIFRLTANATEILPTNNTGTDKTDNEGYTIFEATSEKGTSTFSLFLTEKAVTADYLPSKTSIILVAGIIILFGAGTFLSLFFHRKKKRRKNAKQ